jgi:hypothetical protein
MPCDTRKTVWVCRECDFTTADEKMAMTHSRSHRVVATMPSQEETPFRVVGKCFRCGMKFYTKSTWIAHELGMEQTRQSWREPMEPFTLVPIGGLPNLEQQERRMK